MRIETYKNWKSGKYQSMTEAAKVTQRDVDGLGGKVKFKSEGNNLFTITIRRGEKILNASGILNPGMDVRIIDFLVKSGIYDEVYLDSKVIVYSGEIKGDWRVQKIGAELVDRTPDLGEAKMLHTSELNKATQAANVATITPEEEAEAEAEEASTAVDSTNVELSALKPAFDKISEQLPFQIGDGYKQSFDKKESIKQLQAILNLAFQSGLKIDGKYGPDTNLAYINALISSGKDEASTDTVKSAEIDGIKIVLFKAQELNVDGSKVSDLIASTPVETTKQSSDQTSSTDSTSSGYEFIW
jgi:hypothetical protein